MCCLQTLLKRKENYKIKENFYRNIQILKCFFFLLIRYKPTECPSEFKDYQEREENENVYFPVQT